MINLKKICRTVLLAAFLCTLAGVMSANAKNVVMGSDGTRNPQEEVMATAGAVAKNQCGESCNKDTEDCNPATGKCEKKKVGNSGKVKEGAVTGCSANFGLFSGLINTGKTVFNGLRDLIYVVAGFGIIGVAVGGFFGNLNWKWLGAIIIALVVIATTGEVINLITGCQNFTTSLITDTLK